MTTLTDQNIFDIPAANRTNHWQACLKTLGFTDDQIKSIVAEGIEDGTELTHFSVSDVSSLVKGIRKPGGKGDGEHLTFMQTRLLKGIRFYLHYRHLVHYNSNYLVMADSAQMLLEYKRSEQFESYETPTDEFVLKTSDKNWPKIFERLRGYIADRRGDESKLPLGYIIRDDRDPMKVPDGATAKECMVLRGRQGLRTTNAAGNQVWTPAPHYAPDNAQVWRILVTIFKDTPSYTYIKKFSRSEDGRKAWKALYSQYLGPNNANNLANEMDAALDRLVYSGERRRFTFEIFVNKMVDCFTTIDGLKEYGHSGIDESSKVRRLLKGIKSNTLEVPCGQILAKGSRCTFDEAVRIIKDFMVNKGLTGSQEARDSRQIADVGTSRGGSNRGRRGRNGGTAQASAVVEDRYYSAEEYKKLSNDQKLALKRKREERGQTGRRGGRNGSNGGGSNDGDGDKPQKRTKYDQDQVQAMISSMVSAAISSSKTDGEDGEVDESNSASTGNRNHAALTKSSMKKKVS